MSVSPSIFGLQGFAFPTVTTAAPIVVIPDGTLHHTIHEIIQKLLIDTGAASNPTHDTEWPVYAPDEPDAPDNCITISKTTGVVTGNTAFSGKVHRYHGFQARVRHQNDTQASYKAEALYNFFNESVDAIIVTIDDHSYCVNEITTTSDIFFLGHQRPENRLYLFTINAVVDIKQLT